MRLTYIEITLVALAVSVLAVEARGELAWRDETVEVKVGLGDESAKAAFAFENKGKKPIKIVDVRRSCGCQTVKLKKTEYAPGESGKIEVEVRLGDHIGIVEKTATVKTDDGEEKTLSLRAVVPTPAKADVDCLAWLVGSEGTAKTVKVTACDGMTIRPVAVKCRHSSIEAEYKGDKDGKLVTLTVRPKDLGGSLLSEVTLSLDVREKKTTVRKEIAVPVVVDYDW